MRALGRIGFEEDHLRADLLCGAQRFGERIGGLDRNIDRAISSSVSSDIKDHRHFRQSGERLRVGSSQEPGEFHRDDLRFRFEQQPAQLDGEFDASGDHREVADAAALEGFRALISASRDIPQGLFAERLLDRDPKRLRSARPPFS